MCLRALYQHLKSVVRVGPRSTSEWVAALLAIMHGSKFGSPRLLESTPPNHVRFLHSLTTPAFYEWAPIIVGGRGEGVYESERVRYEHPRRQPWQDQRDYQVSARRLSDSVGRELDRAPVRWAAQELGNRDAVEVRLSGRQVQARREPDALVGGLVAQQPGQEQPGLLGVKRRADSNERRGTCVVKKTGLDDWRRRFPLWLSRCCTGPRPKQGSAGPWRGYSPTWRYRRARSD
jgi:hypothetical protein